MGTKNKRYYEYYGIGEIRNQIYLSSKNGESNFSNLMELIIMEENILLAYRLVKTNSGAKTAGTDEQTIINIADTNKEQFTKMVKQTLINYKPKAIRRVWINKPNGGKRPLGIPSIMDRIIQQMFLNIIEPICEGKFYSHSYGFRPTRSTHHAISRVQTLLNRGWHYSVDVDIKGFFDNVNHTILRKQIWNIGIRDKRVLAIIGKMLKIPIKGEGTPDKGIPQGGILSPLLANIVLNDLDQWIASQYDNFPTEKSYYNKDSKKRALKSTNLKQGYIIRYADDFKILTKNYQTAIKWFHATKKYLKNRLKLDISEDKSHITNTRKKSTEFLGYKLKTYLKGNKFVASSTIGDKKTKQIKETMTNIIKNLNKTPNAQTALKYNSIVLGLHNYFRYATRVSLAFSKMNYKISKLRFNKLKDVAKYGYPDTARNITTYCQFYKKTHKTFTISGIALFPLSQVKTTNIMNYSQETNPFLVNNFAWDKEIIKLMRSNIPNGTTEYMDNRLSLYSMQKGLCAITRLPLTAELVHCHHKIPKEHNGTDSYSNLTIIHKDIHKLIHATKEETIKKYLSTFNLNLQQMKKLNQLRNLCKRENISILS